MVKICQLIVKNEFLSKKSLTKLKHCCICCYPPTHFILISAHKPLTLCHCTLAVLDSAEVAVVSVVAYCPEHVHCPGCGLAYFVYFNPPLKDVEIEQTSPLLEVKYKKTTDLCTYSIGIHTVYCCFIFVASLFYHCSTGKQNNVNYRDKEASPEVKEVSSKQSLSAMAYFAKAHYLQMRIVSERMRKMQHKYRLYTIYSRWNERKYMFTALIFLYTLKVCKFPIH